MVLITLDLIRKRAEHNEGEISTLEELSLHQEDIEKIENLQNWCRELQILYLQSNIISRIENLGKLKKLVYLNLALNNIVKIENLEGCESLEKLDLTLNFIGDLRTVSSLKNNFYLKQLFLIGNPCSDYDGYREYVATVLPFLQSLDGVDITRSERIVASQSFPHYKDQIIQNYDEYQKKRDFQKLVDSNASVSLPDLDNEEEIKEYWSRKTNNTPETRVQLVKDAQMMRNGKKKSKPETESCKPRKLFTQDGRPLNINEARIQFQLIEDAENDSTILDIAVHRFMDSSYLDVDVQPTHVKVLIKGKIFQIVLNHEVCLDSSTAKRSTTTGHLVITMPLLQANRVVKNKVKKLDFKKTVEPNCTTCKIHRREMLEIGSSEEMDFSRIAENNEKRKVNAGKTTDSVQHSTSSFSISHKEKIPPTDFVDNLCVPPLE